MTIPQVNDFFFQIHLQDSQIQFCAQYRNVASSYIPLLRKYSFEIIQHKSFSFFNKKKYKFVHASLKIRLSSTIFLFLEAVLGVQK